MGQVEEHTHQRARAHAHAACLNRAVDAPAPRPGLELVARAVRGHAEQPRELAHLFAVARRGRNEQDRLLGPTGQDQVLGPAFDRFEAQITRSRIDQVGALHRRALDRRGHARSLLLVADLDQTLPLQGAQLSGQSQEVLEGGSARWRGTRRADGVVQPAEALHGQAQHALERPARALQQDDQLEIDRRQQAAHELVVLQRCEGVGGLLGPAHAGVEAQRVGAVLGQRRIGSQRPGDLELGHDAAHLQEQRRVAVAQAHQVQEQLLVDALAQGLVVQGVAGPERPRAVQTARRGGREQPEQQEPAGRSHRFCVHPAYCNRTAGRNQMLSPRSSSTPARVVVPCSGAQDRARRG